MSLLSDASQRHRIVTFLLRRKVSIRVFERSKKLKTLVFETDFELVRKAFADTLKKQKKITKSQADEILKADDLESLGDLVWKYSLSVDYFRQRQKTRFRSKMV